jgi:hypothetical protein
MHAVVICLSIVWLITCFPTSASAEILNQWTFEDPKSALRDLVIQGERPQIVPDPRRRNNKVMLARLRPSADRPERSEVMPGVIKCGQERWIGFRVLRPQQVLPGFLSTFQLGPISDPKGDMHGAVQIITYGNGVWTLRGHKGRGALADGFTQPVAPVRVNQWETWILHVNFRDDAQGIIEAWCNGRPVFRLKGPNGADGDIMRIKWGVYVGKGNDVDNEITTYFDNVTIGGPSSSFSEINKALRN